MPRLLPFLLGLLLVAGCTSEPAESAASPAPAARAAAAALPPSRAGNAEAAESYAQALSVLLEEVVTKNGRVHYDLLRGEKNETFRRVLKAVEDFDAAQLTTQQEKLAFWINAYNVQMLANVLEAWPVRDVSAHSEAFFKEPLRTAGTALSLDQIEHVILRKQSGPQRAEQLQVQTLDPRLHAAVNCAAVSCPKLRREAFTPENVDALLDRAMQDFTGSAGHFRQTQDGDFVLNAIVKWYGTDFDRPGGTPAGDYLLSFMPPYRPDRTALAGLLEGRTAEEIQQQPTVSFDYDWTLNATPASLPAGGTS